MRLLQLSAVDFRNLERVTVNTDARFVVFWGDNAQGKTSLLEAACALATLKSFRAHLNRELVRHGADLAQVQGLVDDGGCRRHFELQIDAAGRRGRVDGKPPRRLEEYFEHIRAVVFTPEDVRIVRGAPEHRRRFLDRAAFTAQATFLALARDFQQALDQKAALLRSRSPDPVALDAYDERLAAAGARLSARRARVVEELRGPFLEVYAAIAQREGVRLRYAARLGEGDEPALAARYHELLQRNRRAELERGGHLDGPQRDELELGLGEHGARAFASQGQARSIALALKLAELIAARRRGAHPLFLLDDLSSELDRLRTGRLVELLASLELQCLITTTDPALLGGLADTRALEVRAGQVLG